MRRGRANALSALLIAAVPLILVGNAAWLLFNPWLVHAEYAIPGFPEPYIELGDEERTDLAVTGIRSVRPLDEGVALLAEAELADGRAAFDERELTHMQDVRDLVTGLVVLWAVALAAGAGAGAWLRRHGERGTLQRALRGGAVVALGVIAVSALVLAVSFDTFFEAFHELFFEGDSWRFNETYTLRSLYPDFFWSVAGGVMALLVAIQAAAVIAATRR